MSISQPYNIHVKAIKPTNMEQGMKRIIRLPEVMHKTGLSKSSIYGGIAVGRFPKQCKIGPRASGWAEESVDVWIDERLSGSNVEVAT